MRGKRVQSAGAAADLPGFESICTYWPFDSE